MLEKYSTNAAYVDCYSTGILGRVSFPEFIYAFYTTPLFKLERLILKLAVSKPSTDFQARQLADGAIRGFAAWHVEHRRDNEILMCDFLERTRSWLMLVPVDGARTQLYFGSAISSRKDSKTGKLSLGLGFRALLGFHKLYSVLLLSLAKSRVRVLVLEKENS